MKSQEEIRRAQVVQRVISLVVPILFSLLSLGSRGRDSLEVELRLAVTADQEVGMGRYALHLGMEANLISRTKQQMMEKELEKKQSDAD